MQDAAKRTIDLAASTLAELLRRYAGDLVTGFHLVGSIADGDFRPGSSDLDFVAVLSRAPGDEDLEAIGLLHRSYGSDPTFPKLDGIWLTEAELRTGPEAPTRGPTTFEGTFVASAGGNRNPVTWVSLRDAVTILGTLDRAALWHDRAWLIAWVRQNAEAYWRQRWLAGAVRPWTPYGLSMFGRAGPMWAVLGTSRQLYTVRTGGIASKSRAGEWALETFGEQKIVREALAQRAGRPSLYLNPLRRRRDALAFVERVIGEIGQSQR